MLLFAVLCFTVKAEKSFIVRQIQFMKTLNQYKRVETSIIWKNTLKNESVQCTSTNVYVYIFTVCETKASEGVCE